MQKACFPTAPEEVLVPLEETAETLSSCSTPNMQEGKLRLREAKGLVAVTAEETAETLSSCPAPRYTRGETETQSSKGACCSGSGVRTGTRFSDPLSRAVSALCHPPKARPLRTVLTEGLGPGQTHPPFSGEVGGGRGTEEKHSFVCRTASPPDSLLDCCSLVRI